ncbi:MAG: type II secretion system F family protein [Candidatus Paceibacterota bacterium]
MKYTYKALRENKIVTGELESEDEDKVAAYLASQDFIVLKIKKKSPPISVSFENFLSKVSFKDVVNLTNQFAIMLGSGLTIIDSLDILRRQAKKPTLLKLINQIEKDVKSGASLSSSLKKRRDLFSDLYIALVRAGEASGKLDEILMLLSKNLERQRTFRSKIKNAMIYPAIILVAMFIVIFIMISFVLPNLLKIFDDFDAKLPLSTRILIKISDFAQAYWWLILFGLIGLVIGLKKYYKSKVGRHSIDNFTLRIPVISNVIKVAALVDSTRTMSILIGSGVSILETIDIISETTSNIVYQNAFRNIHDKIEKGETIAKALEDEKIFPPILVQMASVGEQTGHLDKTLDNLAKYFESESELAVKALTILIEPTILIILGVLVGFVVIAIITPIFSIGSAI